jgi:chemotaxis protein CheD
MTDTMVRMGEIAVATSAGERLVSLGLGSCIGLVLLDRRRGVAGLAHIVLPDSNGHPAVNQLKFADHAVPKLIAQVLALGVQRPRLEAVMVGGASMFAAAGTLDVGSRNAVAVRALLGVERIRIVAVDVGGSHGRTVRVEPTGGVITVRKAGGAHVRIHPALPSNRSLQEVA